MSSIINIKNKSALFKYELVDKLVAGIVLTGTEIKSIRQSKLSFTDAFCTFIKDELWVKSLHISEYKEGTYNNHEPKRDRKLLLNRRELKKFHAKVKETGLTIVPVRVFINDKGLAKMEIALARGKKLFDKRADIKAKDIKRDTERQLKY